jgi:hypothetical protein
VATDVVFFLKEIAKGKDLPWPGPVKLIAVDPSEWFCGGADPRCSTAYTNMHAAFSAAGGGPALPGFVAKYARGVTDIGRIAFVGFSAAHGFLNPLLANDQDRAAVSAVLLLDATFGGGKTGYKKAALDAAKGRMLLATTTANTGGDAGWQLVWNDVQAAYGRAPKEIEAPPGMFQPSGGAWKLGDLLYYYRFVDPKGNSELPHWEMGKATVPLMQSMLVPYWSGQLGGLPWGPIAGVGLALAGGAFAWRLLR